MFYLTISKYCSQSIFDISQNVVSWHCKYKCKGESGQHFSNYSYAVDFSFGLGKYLTLCYVNTAI